MCKAFAEKYELQPLSSVVYKLFQGNKTNKSFLPGKVKKLQTALGFLDR